MNIRKRIIFSLVLIISVGLLWQTVNAAPALQSEPPYVFYFPIIQKSDPTPVPSPTPSPTAVPTTAPGPPAYYTTSWYMTPQNIYNTYQMGCQAGQQTVQLAGIQDSLVILDFGQPWGDSNYLGTIILKETREDGWKITSISEITLAVQEFVNGYMACSDHVSTIDVAIGTTNFAFLLSWAVPGCPAGTIRWMCYENNAYIHGRAWAEMTRNVYSWVVQRGYANQVTVSGATDIELAWNYPLNTIAWVDGFNDNDNNSVIYYDYGTCDGCPTRFQPNTNPSLVNGWTMTVAHYTAWRVAPAWPIPEIYTTTGTYNNIYYPNGINAAQWSYLSKWGVDHGYEKMIFLSAMTQLQACGGVNNPECEDVDNTPQQAWYQLFNEVNFWPGTSLDNIPWMTDIDWP